MEFQHQEVEDKWKKIWKEEQIYKVLNDFSKPKYYVLDMFPYPSGAGLHVGHPLGYIASDIVARQKRMKGYNVLHPMGFDAFGLPAEQYAIQTGIHPAISTMQNIERYHQQLDNIGFNYDWSREVITCKPEYYKWTQWIFLKLYNHYYNTKEQKAKPILELISLFENYGNLDAPASTSEDSIFSSTEWNEKSALEKDIILMNYRLAYRKTSFVNWCEALGTVLANDEIKDGVSERGGHPVEKKPMMQWALRISAYAERLLNDLETLEWSEALKNMQKNWIGKSVGAQVFFTIENQKEVLEIFTTRPDTLFGASFMVLAPEHPLVNKITTDAQKNAIINYIEYSKKRSERERQAETKSVTGVFTGAYALHPFTNEKLPIWISDYVLIDYGTGAIMAVPSNDKRDQLFAIKFDLPIIKVIDQTEFPGADLEDLVGTLINSSFLNSAPVTKAIDMAIESLAEKNIGRKRIQYKMRDANFSRQRYWGEPFPVYYNTEGVSFILEESMLPLELPHIDSIEPGKGGRSPLNSKTDWVHWNGFERETDTMPGYAGSSWYFLRYMDALNNTEFASKETLEYWQDVDLYIGGTEHAVGHLMYSRFWHKFLYDLEFVPTIEPFKKLVNQGMIQGIIESLLLVKESQPPHFIDPDIAEKYNDDQLAKIPVHIDFIQQYNTPNSHLSKSGLKQFIQWRPEFEQAFFENATEKNTVDKISDAFKIQSYSETGKMSKRYHNVVNPDDVIAEYGADCFRMYEMFLGPIEQSKPWDTKGIDGVSKFIRKFYSLFYNEADQFVLSDDGATGDEFRILHTCIKKVNQDIEQLSFNTSISAFMICVNELKRIGCNKKEILLPLTQLLAPFAPFITEEIWAIANNSGSIHHAAYPEHLEMYLVKDEVNYPISINGKKRFEWIVSKSLTQDQLQDQVLKLEEISKWVTGQQIKKIIIVPGRMINIVL
ncbi:MAG: leucine--tRNA ligase [Saprospiraceae bacterium]|nr:leucine--tRNA ligase [Saprospiraceae bacterium]